MEDLVPGMCFKLGSDFYILMKRIEITSEDNYSSPGWEVAAIDHATMILRFISKESYCLYEHYIRTRLTKLSDISVVSQSLIGNIFNYQVKYLE